MKRELSVEDIQLEQGIFSRLAKKRLDQCFVGNKEIFETANQLMWMLVSYGEYEKIEKRGPRLTLLLDECSPLYHNIESTDVLYDCIKKDLEICRIMNIIKDYWCGVDRIDSCEVWDGYEENGAFDDYDERLDECNNCNVRDECFKKCLKIDFNPDFTEWGHGIWTSTQFDRYGAYSLESVMHMLCYTKDEIKKRICNEKTYHLGKTIFVTADEIESLAINRLEEIKKETATK